MVIALTKLVLKLIKIFFYISFKIFTIAYSILKWIFAANNEKTYIDKNGYRRFNDSDIPVHRWVAEKFILNGKLRNGEVVHHINRNKLDNSPENLYIFKNQKEHDRAHKEDSKRFGKKNSYKGFHT